jgi:methionyl-tRNA synthetase
MATETVEEISIKEFKRLDIRIGTVIEVEKIPSSDKLYRQKVNMGDHVRQIVSGLAEYYKPEELKGMRIALVCNLKPAKIFGNMSNGMLLAAEKDGKLALLTTDREIPNGAKIT